jgi:hypothetical protein
MSLKSVRLKSVRLKSVRLKSVCRENVAAPFLNLLGSSQEVFENLIRSFYEVYNVYVMKSVRSPHDICKKFISSL